MQHAADFRKFTVRVGNGKYEFSDEVISRLILNHPTPAENSPTRPRKTFDEERLEELAESIRIPLAVQRIRRIIAS